MPRMWADRKICLEAHAATCAIHEPVFDEPRGRHEREHTDHMCARDEHSHRAGGGGSCPHAFFTGDDAITLYEAFHYRQAWYAAAEMSSSEPSHASPVGAAPQLAAPTWLRWVAVGMCALATGWAVYYVSDLSSSRTLGGLRLLGKPVPAMPIADLPSYVHAQTDRLLDEPVELEFTPADAKLAPRKAKRRELGYRIDVDGLVARAAQLGRTHRPLSDLWLRVQATLGRVEVPIESTLNRDAALEYLGTLKDDVDRAPLDARLDLEHHTIKDSQPGIVLSVYESLGNIEQAALYGKDKAVIALRYQPARVQAADLKNIEISQVLGTWETKYSASQTDTDRTYNLKVGASKLNGKILQPHEQFSFNEVVGDRTEKEGYRVAPVISGGELVDGLAGGMCQIASTLHGAAFFAGLDIVSSTPHSRPSAYITMGLDSTVVYPSTDLKLRNPYDFPIVMHYTVNQGSVKVELLGKDRPYQVIFEREIKAETGFGTSSRSDPAAPQGQKFPLQEGYPGYTLVRRRYIFPKGQVPKYGGKEPLADMLKKQKIEPLQVKTWQLHYPSTETIMAYGSGPKALKKKDPPPSHHIPPLSPDDKPFFRILK
jgi:vancomycin resistance protein YoaR